jgi:hypothetical protein
VAAWLEREKLRVAETVEVIPFEAAQIRFPWLGAVSLQQLLHTLGAIRLPGLLGQVHVGRWASKEYSSLEGKLIHDFLEELGEPKS